MNKIAALIRMLTKICGWMAVGSAVFIMCFTAVAIISRKAFVPIYGDVEIVQVALLILLMSAVSYTQFKEKHVSVGLITDRFSPKVQEVFKLLGHLVTLGVCILIAYFFWGFAVQEYAKSYHVATDLLDIPFYPLKFAIFIGFGIWGLAAGLHAWQSIQKIRDFGRQPANISEGE